MTDTTPQIVQIVDGYALSANGTLYFLDGPTMHPCKAPKPEPETETHESFGGTE